MVDMEVKSLMKRWKALKEFSNGFCRGKLKTRGKFKALLFAYTMAISINFGRIYRYSVTNPADFNVNFAKYLSFNSNFLFFNEIYENFYLIFYFVPNFCLKSVIIFFEFLEENHL